MMPIQKLLSDFQTSGHQIGEIGSVSKNKKIFLAYTDKRGWYLKEFDMGFVGNIQLLLRRCLGWYTETHLTHTLKQLNREKLNCSSDPNLATLYRTLRAHWHQRGSFGWNIDQCINCFAKERFKEAGGKRHPFCGKSCATEYKLQEKEIVPGYTLAKAKEELEAYAKKGYVDFYEAKYNPLTSLFGNFHPCPVAVEIKGKVYNFRCAEAAFQAHKFQNYENEIQQFLTLNGPAAFHKAKKQQSKVQSDWQTENVQVMKTVLHEKFKQNPELTQLLLATGSAILIEHTSRDQFWGDAGNGHGANKLGELLMDLRHQLGGKEVSLTDIDYKAFAAKLPKN